MTAAYGWRVWLAFEVRPGITRTARDLSGHWRGLADACRGVGGKIDAVEFDHWLTLLIEHAHLWGHA